MKTKILMVVLLGLLFSAKMFACGIDIIEFRFYYISVGVTITFCNHCSAGGTTKCCTYTLPPCPTSSTTLCLDGTGGNGDAGCSVAQHISSDLAAGCFDVTISNSTGTIYDTYTITEDNNGMHIVWTGGSHYTFDGVQHPDISMAPDTDGTYFNLSMAADNNGTGYTDDGGYLTSW